MKNIAILLNLLSILVLSGCENYTYTFNEQPVFEQPDLFTDYKITDQGLSNCVKQAIFDEKAHKAGALRQLNCSNAGIRTLAGLEVFTGLTHVNLENNSLTEIKPLLFLGQLKTVLLAGNDKLNCVDARLLAEQTDGQVSLPTHCTQ